MKVEETFVSATALRDTEDLGPLDSRCNPMPFSRARCGEGCIQPLGAEIKRDGFCQYSGSTEAETGIAPPVSEAREKRPGCRLSITARAPCRHLSRRGRSDSPRDRPNW